jgi:predicted RNase H-like HicB family nuclease
MFIVISERRGTKHPWTPENKERNAFYAVSYELPRFCLQGNTSAEAIKKAKDAINFYKG